MFKMLMLQLLSYRQGQVIVASVVLCLLQTTGLVITLYLLISPQQQQQHSAWQNICTEAMLCLLYRYGPHLAQTGDHKTGLTGQVLYSVVAICVNIALVCGALWRRPGLVLPWLVVYGVSAVLGNLVLVMIIPLTVVVRYRETRDVYLISILWFLVPLLLLIAYSLLWSQVFRVHTRLRKELQALILVNT